MFIKEVEGRMRNATFYMHEQYIATFVDVLLTVHLSIILENDKLDAQILCFILSFITVLYMFRATSCST
jgi:hypothetical protein